MTTYLAKVFKSHSLFCDCPVFPIPIPEVCSLTRNAKMCDQKTCVYHGDLQRRNSSWRFFALFFGFHSFFRPNRATSLKNGKATIYVLLKISTP